MLKKDKIQHVDGCLVNEDRINKFEKELHDLIERRPDDDAVAIAATLSKHLGDSQGVINSHGKSINDIYRQLELLSFQFDVWKAYVKELTNWLKENCKK